MRHPPKFTDPVSELGDIPFLDITQRRSRQPRHQSTKMAKEAPAKTGLTVGLNRGHVRVVKVSPRGGSLLRSPLVLREAVPVAEADDGR